MANSTVLPTSGQTRDQRFFFAFTLVLLGILILGFAPSLYLRIAFENPPIPFYLHLHGVLLTGWFVLLVTQAWLVRSGNVRVHQKLGVFAAIYSLVVVAGGLMATFNFIQRAASIGIGLDTDVAEIDPGLGSGLSFLQFASGVVWANMASVALFAIFTGTAVALRRRSDFHKRLILIGTISIMGPALARISRLEILGGEQGPFIPLAMLSLLGAIWLYDLITLKKIHKATLLASLLAIAVNMLAFRIAASEIGLNFARGLA